MHGERERFYFNVFSYIQNSHHTLFISIIYQYHLPVLLFSAYRWQLLNAKSDEGIAAASVQSKITANH